MGNGFENGLWVGFDGGFGMVLRLESQSACRKNPVAWVQIITCQLLHFFGRPHRKIMLHLATVIFFYDLKQSKLNDNNFDQALLALHNN